ncbi:hypothetical protein B0H10DRAFT_1854422, partial [Mycena sp. CBHHK59/15]
IVVDGNFKLENLKMRNPEDDVHLSDGQMFFVGSVLYDEHRSNCNNHRAVNETNVKCKEVDSIGIGACAGARHGCFYPHCVVGFQLGERQKNMDYAISEVFRQLPPEIKQMLLMYDISCQWVLRWIQHFKDRKYLFYRKDLELFAAVGKFHLGAHILECFLEFSLNFMEGSGQVDGEILETLWAALDKVVGSTRKDEDDEDAGTTYLVENIRLSLPSSPKAKHMGAEQYKDLCRQEATLHEGQINDALQGLRIALGEKAWMLRNNVRDASGGKDKLHAWSGVTKKSKDVRKHLKIYNHAYSALQHMGQGEKWKPITKTDLNMKGDMIEVNCTGQRAHTLAWFWRLEDSPASDEIQQSGKMLECECFHYCIIWHRPHKFYWIQFTE